ncbi:ABC transporter substrate-binding protein [Spongisporangium articulatum]|uniref:ABC transporter substrate-binding protein n=1 Tax=Spongisporangium articulatum TaxID=3362603 RepID=A0ABW8AQX6_9ACTN
MRIQKVTLPLAGVALIAAVAGCAPTDSASDAATPSASLSCSPADLKTKTANTLTVGTDKPAYPPWFVDDKPSNGKGLESAVAYAVAKQLGYTQDQVKWVTASFNSVIQPGAKSFDVDINQFSITDERKKAVDFSSGYYDVTQAVITTKGSEADGVTTLAGLQALKLGAQVGTTSYKAITDQIKPTQTPAVFDDNDKAKLALKNGQVDALVVDLPTGLYITAAELDDGLVVGQLENTTGTPEQFGMVLEKGSSLTPCVSQAVDTLRSNGTLAQLADTWLAQGAGAPVLK